MMKSLLFTATKLMLLDKNIMLRVFMYSLGFAGLIWVSIANYYYYTLQDSNFWGALTSSFILLGSAVCIKLFLHFSCRSHCKINNLTSKLNAVTPVFGLASSPFANMFYSKAKRLAKENKIASFTALGAVGLVTFYIFYNLIGDKDKHFFNQ